MKIIFKDTVKLFEQSTVKTMLKKTMSKEVIIIISHQLLVDWREESAQQYIISNNVFFKYSAVHWFHLYRNCWQPEEKELFYFFLSTTSIQCVRHLHLSTQNKQKGGSSIYVFLENFQAFSRSRIPKLFQEFPVVCLQVLKFNFCKG